MKFVFLKTVYRAPHCKRLVGVDAEVKELRKVLEYGLKRKKCGKIVMRKNKLSLSQEKLLGVSLMGKGINITGNIPLVMEEICDIFSLKDLTNNQKLFKNKQNNIII